MMGKFFAIMTFVDLALVQLGLVDSRARDIFNGHDGSCVTGSRRTPVCFRSVARYVAQVRKFVSTK